MEYTKEKIKEAYVKLKSYIYYDNTDILLRRQLVEFETSIGKETFIDNPSSHYNIGNNIFNYRVKFSIEEKFDRIAKELNNFNQDQTFFNTLLEKININFYPKKIIKEEKDENYITNVRVRDTYEVERLTPFINAPIELHIISVLWIMEYGVRMDAKLGNKCFGNRLLLNKDKSEIVQGSGLFKPYYNQYQKWRDNGVEVAEKILKEGNNVAFINLDIKDYFSSVRIDRTYLFDGRKHKVLNNNYNLQEIFLLIHDRYTKLLLHKYKEPGDLYSSLLNKDGNPQKVILPIGLVSSYVLANDYLHRFDERILTIIKPVYYGRYVDDMIFVISNPIPDFKINETNKKLKFNLSKYENIQPSKLERFVLETFYPLIDLVPDNNSSNKEGKCFRIEEYEALECQSGKSLMYYFDSNESHLVIDKLKQKLDERTSEFRDFPEENVNDLSFKTSAYHLLYDESEGKINTLKDYKENRFGISIFLSNKIFSALRHENHLSDEEADQIINFFKGETCLSFYRMWERILTLLMVNQKPKQYVEFFLHCIIEIDKIKYNNFTQQNLIDTLINYIDVAHEMTLSLNLEFLAKAKSILRNFEFKINSIERNHWACILGDFKTTKPDSFWIRRFRTSNMMRHHYVVHPLLTYSEASKKGEIKDLTSLNLYCTSYKLDSNLVSESPRRVKFSECCLSLALEQIGKQDGVLEINNKVVTDIFGYHKKKKNKFYLDDAYDRFKQINKNHIPSYEFENDSEYKEQIFQIKSEQKINSPIVNIQEIVVNKRQKQDHKFKIAFANTKVEEGNAIASMRGTPILNSIRYNKLAGILEKARIDKSDILLFPEFFIPVNLLSSLVNYSERNDVLTITGLEHIKIKNTIFNFIVTILPFSIGGVNDAIVVFRLKNHYAPSEELLIKGNHYKVAAPKDYRYDIFNWKNLYFSPYYCFELANVWHRSLFRSKLDLLIGVEYNQDTPYYSNIVESCSRDLHCYIAQVNTSHYGDSRLTQPTESCRQDIIKLKGGMNDSILVAEINLNTIREFQRKTYALTYQDKEYKPLPPDYDVNSVIKRINNESIL